MLLSMTCCGSRCYHEARAATLRNLLPCGRNPIVIGTAADSPRLSHARLLRHQAPRSRVHLVIYMPHDLIPHRPLRRHGSTCPVDDHATSRGMGGRASPRFPISPTSAFSSTCCSCCWCRCCCRGVHTATPCDLKSPFRYARRGCPRVYLHHGASAAGILPSFHRDTAVPACSYSFTIGQFRRWWYSSHPCSTSGGWRLIPTGLPLYLALEAGLHPNQFIENKTLFQYSRP